MSQRVLIISPHFPPVNAPDMQRVRVSLPYFVAAGWEVTVLTVADPTPAAPVDAELGATIPAAVRVVRAHCFSRTWTRWLGIGNVALRSLPFLFFAGWRLLAAHRYDVVYFSTTMFIVLPFGRIWRRLRGVPYVIDLQDPWVTDYYERPGSPPPPGGWKYAFSRRLGLLLEGWTLRRVAHVITVSGDYPTLLRRRYPWLATTPFTELPFAAPDPDLAYLQATVAQRPPILAAGAFRLAFVGALGPGMLGTVEALVAAVAEVRGTGPALSVDFIGTSYAGGGRGRPAIAALVQEYHVEDCVRENPERLRYFDALQVTLEADVNLLFGSTELSFTPSKILALLAAGRPILAIAHNGSALAARLALLGQPCVVLAGSRPTAAEINTVADRLRALQARAVPPPPAPPDALRARAAAACQLEILAGAASGGG